MISTAEAMAIEVLKGDMVAARALADLLVEEFREGAKEIVPVKEIGRYAMGVVHVPQNRYTQAFAAQVGVSLGEFINRRSHLVVPCDCRVEFYELK